MHVYTYEQYILQPGNINRIDVVNMKGKRSIPWPFQGATECSALYIG